MIRLRFVSLALFVSLLASAAFAWNQAGHMTTAAIAYDTLKKDNPQALAKVLTTLRQHPQFDTMWAKQINRVDPADQDEALFMLAARWPDDIRDNPDYNHGEWHYIDYPFKPAGQPDSVLAPPPVEPNLEVAYRNNIDVLKRPDSTPGEQAIALCWIMHLTGDSHQPLHSVSLFTTDFTTPSGDKGGNLEYIRAKADSQPIKLHKFWDDLVIGSLDTREVHKKAIELRANYPRVQLDKQPKAVTPDDVQKWIQESFQLAKSDVYLQGKLPFSTQRNDAPVLPDDYIAKAKVTGERRATQSGYRMADVLLKVAPNLHGKVAPAK
jgi:hypothetical protein